MRQSPLLAVDMAEPTQQTTLETRAVLGAAVTESILQQVVARELQTKDMRAAMVTDLGAAVAVAQAQRETMRLAITEEMVARVLHHPSPAHLLPVAGAVEARLMTREQVGLEERAVEARLARIKIAVEPLARLTREAVAVGEGDIRVPSLRAVARASLS